MSLFSISFWLVLSELAFNLSGYVIHAFLGRFLGPAEYGRLGIIITFSTMIVVLIGRGIPIAMSKYLSEIKKEDLPQKAPEIKNLALWEQLKIALILTAVYWLLSPVFAFLLKDASLKPLFQLSSLVVLTFSLASFFVYYFNGIEFFGRQAGLKLARALFRAGLVIGLGFFFRVEGAIWGQVLAPLFVFLLSLILDPFKTRKSSCSRLNPTEKKELKSKLLRFAWPVTLFLVFYELMISIDLYLVKALLQDDRQAGIYNAALTVGRLPYYAFYFLTFLILPKISKAIFLHDKKSAQKIMKNLFRFLIFLLLPTIALTSFFAPSLVEFFYGPAYAAAARPMSLLAWGVGFLTVFHILVSALNGSGRNRVPMWLAFGGMLVNAGLNFIFIQKWGLLGSAWATTLTAFLTMGLAVFYTQKKICFFFNGRVFVKGFLVLIPLLFISRLLFFQDKFLFIPFSLIFLTVYLLALFAWGEIKKKDWQLLLEKKKSSTDSEML